MNTPELQIADNDYSVGLVADTIAHSRYANNTLIFVIEDDPPQTFNRIIWEGMKGTPYPTRSGSGLKQSGTPQPEPRQSDRNAGSK